MLNLERHITAFRGVIAVTLMAALLVPLFVHLCLLDGATPLIAGGECCERAKQEQTGHTGCHGTAPVDHSGAETLDCCQDHPSGLLDEAILALREEVQKVAEHAAAFAETRVLEPAADFLRDLASRLLPERFTNTSAPSIHLLNSVFLN